MYRWRKVRLRRQVARYKYRCFCLWWGIRERSSTLQKLYFQSAYTGTLGSSLGGRDLTLRRLELWRHWGSLLHNQCCLIVSIRSSNRGRRAHVENTVASGLVVLICIRSTASTGLSHIVRSVSSSVQSNPGHRHRIALETERSNLLSALQKPQQVAIRE